MAPPASAEHRGASPHQRCVRVRCGSGLLRHRSVVSLNILVLWLVGVVLGDDRVRQLATEIGRVAPKNLGADRIVERVARLGAGWGWSPPSRRCGRPPRTAQGWSGRFDRLGPKRDERLEGLRGRGLFFLILPPVFVREPWGELRGALRDKRPGSEGTSGGVVVPFQCGGAGVISGRPGDVRRSARRRSTRRSGGSARDPRGTGASAPPEGGRALA